MGVQAGAVATAGTAPRAWDLLTARESKLAPATGAQVRPFDALTLEEQKAHFLDVARRAAALWGWSADETTFKLLNITENATYKLSAPGRDPICMRVHRLDYAERASIECELAWIDELARTTDLNLAAPIKGLDGELVQQVATPELNEVRNVVCFTFAMGTAPVDSTDDTEELSGILSALGKIPNGVTFPVVRMAACAYDKMARGGDAPSAMTEQDAWLYRELGRAAAVMRTRAVEWLPAHRELAAHRIAWDWDATFGPRWNNYYGRHYWDADSTLSQQDIATLDAAAAVMHRRLEAFGCDPSRYGLVHTDLRMGNLLVDGDRLTVLDFDDCGMGWYLFDIAGMVGFAEHRGDLHAVLAEILKGYESVWKLDEDERREIPTFILMRRIGLLQALMYHITNAEPGSNESGEITPDLIAFYAKGTVQLARRYMRMMKDAPLAGDVLAA